MGKAGVQSYLQVMNGYRLVGKAGSTPDLYGQGVQVLFLLFSHDRHFCFQSQKAI